MRVGVLFYLSHIGSMRQLVLSLIVLFSVFATQFSSAQDDQDDEFRPGLIAHYTDAEGREVVRLDRQIAFAWDDGAPDRRLSNRGFNASWRGFLMSQGRGEYQLHAYLQGEVQIKLRRQVVLDGKTEHPAWLHGKPVDLPFDWHPFEVSFRKNGVARLSLFWSGPQFQLEPIPVDRLFHDPADTPDSSFERGELLTRALRCAACHEIPGHGAPLPAPDLTNLAGNVRTDWLIDWLTDAGDEPRPGEVVRRMPRFGFSRADATSLAAFLLPPQELPTTAKQKPDKADRAQGETLFLTLGCLACHQANGLDASGLFGGGDLSNIARKRPAEFFTKWLANPAQFNKNHRMPVFDLSDEERENLAAYLATQSGDSDAPDETPGAPVDPTLRQHGQTLFVQYRCAACHAPTIEHDDSHLVVAAKLSNDNDWSHACTGTRDLSRKQPGYALSAADRTAIQSYVSAVSRVAGAADEQPDGKWLLVENNCLACHLRDEAPGLAPKLSAVAQAHESLAALVPAMTPPPLTSVGDKLYDDALVAAIRRSANVHRPWLTVRMPRFPFTDSESRALVDYFVAADRIPDLPSPSESIPSGEVLRIAGARLVTSDGFGCTSCHQIGHVIPPDAPLNARGPDLSQLGERIRQPWFDRWVRNPARIVPRMEMPSVQVAVRGVLDENLDDQLASVWHVLNVPGFEPPQPNPLRVVRQSGNPHHPQSAAVLTDVLTVDNRTLIKPLIIGLNNRHSMLFDLATNRLAGWWIGDVARQRTEGKSWYWEQGGVDLLPTEFTGSDISLLDGDGVHEPRIIGQFTTELDAWRHVAGGVAFDHRLHFAVNAASQQPTLVLHVTQTVNEIVADPEEQRPVSGVERRIEIRGVPSELSVRLRVGDGKRPSASLSADHHSLSFGSAGTTSIRLTEPRDAQIDDDGFVTVRPGDTANDSVTIVLQYLTTLPVDQFVLDEPDAEPLAPQSLDVLPGFETVRLPLADEWMPTGLAWRPDGTLVVSSLKGRIWLARDTDGDGLEDRAQPFSDELAAPYGVATNGDAIDVINKYALLRLHDDDHDGRAERTQLLASGWGHTADYHDWAIGLPRDAQGNYYVGLPCQQDERSLAAANWRGQVVKLVPRNPTADDPRTFSIQPISAGHRFPMGLARDLDGELFVTDNQGNYNPFNELNHVIPGARYGFINALERRPGFNPPLTPPAIDIPHPWTRSVNGICFLDTPVKVETEVGRKLFGPFEGHLIGCEYDTRRLIRMSLQRVGDTYQGAAYPFTFDQPRSGPPLLGPLVCAIAPDGDLYVGGIRDSGWGGANDIGELVRMRPIGETMPPGIAEVQAVTDGFIITFTQPVDRRAAAIAANYSLSSYTRVSTPAYGGADQNRRTEKIIVADVSPDGRRVTLRLGELRAGFVYELQVKNLLPDDRQFFPAEAYYTLRTIPR